MSEAEKQVLENIKKFAPKDFGVRRIYYRSITNGLEVLFLVDKEKAGNLIGYLNSLSALIAKDTKNIKIECSVYVDEKGKDMDKVAKKEKLERMELSSMNFAGAHA